MWLCPDSCNGSARDLVHSTQELFIFTLEKTEVQKRVTLTPFSSGLTCWSIGFYFRWFCASTTSVPSLSGRAHWLGCRAPEAGTGLHVACRGKAGPSPAGHGADGVMSVTVMSLTPLSVPPDSLRESCTKLLGWDQEPGLGIFLQEAKKDFIPQVSSIPIAVSELVQCL